MWRKGTADKQRWTFLCLARFLLLQLKSSI
jgi:hypothetical protein